MLDVYGKFDRRHCAVSAISLGDAGGDAGGGDGMQRPRFGGQARLASTVQAFAAALRYRSRNRGREIL